MKPHHASVVFAKRGSGSGSGLPFSFGLGFSVRGGVLVRVVVQVRARFFEGGAVPARIRVELVTAFSAVQECVKANVPFSNPSCERRVCKWTRHGYSDSTLCISRL